MDENYTYRCVKCKDQFTTDHPPRDYRIMTGKFLSCCDEPMQLITKTEGDDK